MYFFEFEDTSFRALKNSSSIYAGAMTSLRLKENIKSNKHLVYYVYICWACNRYFAILMGFLFGFPVVHRHTSLRISRPGISASCDLFSKVGNVGRRKMKERAVVYGR